MPDLAFSEQEAEPIGLWGQGHIKYVKQRGKIRYIILLTSGKLNEHLIDIDKQAEDLFSRLVKQMAEREGITEHLKADNPMEWIARMNSICGSVMETVNNDTIYIKIRNSSREESLKLLCRSNTTARNKTKLFLKSG